MKNPQMNQNSKNGKFPHRKFTKLKNPKRMQQISKVALLFFPNQLMDIIRSIQVKILGKFRPPPTSRTCISDPSEFPHFECLSPVLNQIICIVVTLGKRCWWPMENALLFHRPQQQEENKREKVSASHCGQNENDRIREIT